MDDDDIIRDLVRRARAVSTGVPDETWAIVEIQARLTWGGSRPYVAKDPDRGKAAGLAWRLGTGATLREACAEVGVSMRHGYRLVGLRWSVFP